MNTMVNDADTFAKAAEYYNGRTAYSDEFFKKLVQELKITRESSILDLACGGGELTLGLAQYAGQLTGIDKSDAMLKNATARTPPNVHFYQQDLNHSPVTTATKVDFVTIGRAIQYLVPAILKTTLSTSLKPEGLVIICGAGIGKETQWLAPYQQIRRKVRVKQTHPDFHGLQKMQSIGFTYLGTIADTVMARYALDDILNHALSYSSETKNILENIESFTAELESGLAPFKETDGTFSASESSWAHVFRSQPL